MNIVASDQIGRFPDASAPEAVQRLPGIAVARDQGEGRYIQIRGGSAANTQVNFNGVQIPSPEGEVRQIALDAVPVDVLESIEVSKAILPDMDADAIGGTVNLVTRKAPMGRMLTIEGSGGFAAIRDDPSGSGALTFGTRSSDGRLGLLLSGSYSRRNFGSDDVEPVYDLDDPGTGDDALEELEVRHYTLWRSRAGVTTNLDYRLSETSSLFLTGIFSNLTDEEQRRNLVSVLEDDVLEFRHNNRHEELRTYSFTLGGEHLLGRGATFDYSAAWTAYITDNYEPTEDVIPPDSMLGRRVRQYRVTVAGPAARAELIRTFGDTIGPGVLRVVESIAIDPANNRLLIAEEQEGASMIKVYNLEGMFTGDILPSQYFPHQAEGIVLYECGDSAGYWIATDQGVEVNTFHVFDRITLAHVGSFRGPTVLNADGIALTQRNFASFPTGAFYAVHNDGSLVGFSWGSVAEAIGGRADCTLAAPGARAQ